MTSAAIYKIETDFEIAVHFSNSIMHVAFMHIIKFAHNMKVSSYLYLDKEYVLEFIQRRSLNKEGNTCK